MSTRTQHPGLPSWAAAPPTVAVLSLSRELRLVAAPLVPLHVIIRRVRGRASPDLTRPAAGILAAQPA